MGDPLGEFEPRGALRECFESFPEFRDELEFLVNEGYMKVAGPETCVWLKSKTSLAEYFKWTGWDAEGIIGGFWAPIENAFGIKRHTLRKLAGNNANPLKPDESRDFKAIKEILQKRRKQEEVRQFKKRVFRYIKRLILLAENEDDETINEILQKIFDVFEKLVDKNGQNRRQGKPKS